MIARMQKFSARMQKFSDHMQKFSVVLIPMYKKKKIARNSTINRSPYMTENENETKTSSGLRMRRTADGRGMEKKKQTPRRFLLHQCRKI